MLNLRERLQEHNLTLVAAGVGFYGFVALVPSLIVLVTVYGIFGDPAELERQIEESTQALPEEARALIVSQISGIANGSTASLSLAAVVSLLVALYSASAAMANLIRGIDIAFRRKRRKFVEMRAMAIGLTLGAIVYVVVLFGLAAAAPAYLAWRFDRRTGVSDRGGRW